MVKGDLDSDKPVVVLGVVYAPGQIDTQGEAMTVEAIEEMAYQFMREHRLDKIDIYHNEKPTGSVVVENTIIRGGDPDFPEGSWLLGVEIYDASIKADVKSGKLGGYSWGGSGTPVVTIVRATTPVKSEGTVEKSIDGEPLPKHDHELILYYDEHAKPIMTKTSVSMGHDHDVMGTTTTEVAFGHAHRMKLDVLNMAGDVSGRAAGNA